MHTNDRQTNRKKETTPNTLEVTDRPTTFAMLANVKHRYPDTRKHYTDTLQTQDKQHTEERELENTGLRLDSWIGESEHRDKTQR